MSLLAEMPWPRVYAFFTRWRDAGLVAELHERLRPRCSCAGVGESRVQPGGDPVEDHTQVPFEPPVAVVEEAPGLLDQ